MNEIEEMTNETDRVGRLRDQKRKRKRQQLRILLMSGCVILFVAIMAVSVKLYIWLDKSLQKEPQEVANLESDGLQEEVITYTQEELDAKLEEAIAEAQKDGAQQVLNSLEESFQNSSTVVGALRPLYEDKLIVASEGQYHFVPINYDLKMHSYTNENLQILDNGLVEYVENGTVISHKGIDVSKHQGEIDWAKVAADGVEFAFIRVGNRGYGSGAIVEDPQFEANVVGAISNNIKVGVYFFSQAVTVEEAKEEAEFVLNKIAPYRITCPVVLDVEKVADDQARMNLISKEERTANTIAFLEAIEAAGYKTMLYHNMEMGTLMMDMTQLEKYEKWLAYYNKEFYYPYDFSIWQYSDKGKVDGINGNVDMNISFHLWEE